MSKLSKLLKIVSKNHCKMWQLSLLQKRTVGCCKMFSLFITCVKFCSRAVQLLQNCVNTLEIEAATTKRRNYCKMRHSKIFSHVSILETAIFWAVANNCSCLLDHYNVMIIKSSCQTNKSLGIIHQSVKEILTPERYNSNNWYQS